MKDDEEGDILLSLCNVTIYWYLPVYKLASKRIICFGTNYTVVYGNCINVTNDLCRKISSDRCVTM